MPTPPKKLGPLTQAAAALEGDVDALEAVAAEVGRVRLDTRKNLERRAREIARAAETQTRLQERLGELSRQLLAVQERAIASGTRVRDLGEDLKAAQARYLELVGAYEVVVREAVRLREIATSAPSELANIQGGLLAAAEGMAEVAAQAREAGFRDLAEEATGRRQQFEALANRIATG